MSLARAPLAPTIASRRPRGRRETRVRARPEPDDPIGTLYDVPVSNNGARCRLLARWLKVYHLIDVVDPTRAFDGGIKGPAYEAINPQLKMPALTLADESMSLGESEVINQYLLDGPAGRAWSEKRPRTPEARAVGALATRTHDLYIGPIQGAMYRGPMDREPRATQIEELKRQLKVLDEIAGRVKGRYVCGQTKSSADAAIFPTLIFCDFLLPKYFGWKEAFGPNLRRMYDAMMEDVDAETTYAEVLGGLEAWEAAGRFERVGIVEDVADDAYRWAY